MSKKNTQSAPTSPLGSPERHWVYVALFPSAHTKFPSVLISFSPIQQFDVVILYNSVFSSEDVIVAMSYPPERHCSLASA